MSFKIIIPARFSSSRLPGKPLLAINNHPMIWHVYQRAIETGISVNNIVIATDNDEIFSACKQFGAQAVLTAASHESGTDRLAEVVTTLKWDESDIVVNLQGDEPLIPPALIKETAALLASDIHVGMSTLACPISGLRDVQNPNIVKLVCDKKGYALYFSRACIPFDRDNTVSFDSTGTKEQASDTPYFRHIGMYAYRVKTLKKLAKLPVSPLEKIEKLEQLRALYNGIKIKVGIVNKAPVHGVDTQEDLERVRLAIKNLY